MYFSSICSNENVFLIINLIVYFLIIGRSWWRKGIKIGYGGKKKKKKKNKWKKKKKNKKKKNKKNKNFSDKKIKNFKNKKVRI